ncbi:MAG: sensor histidine kinase [Bacillota bacterium]
MVNEVPAGTLWLPSGHPFGVENIRSKVSSSLLATFIISVAASSAIAFIISYILANRISRPLMSLSGAVRQVGRRRFDLRLPVTSKDEIGVVIQAFNEMSGELQRSEQARSNLVADVAHELRTPLTVIQGQLESIQQGIMPASVETVLPIHDEVIRLNRLVDDLRQLTLAEAGKLPLNRIPTDLGRAVRKIADNFQLEAEARGIELRLAGSGGPHTVPVDPDRFTQIVVNLLGNALNYTPPGGMVSIGLAGADFAPDSDLTIWCEKFSAAEAAVRHESGCSSQTGEWTGAVVWVADMGPGIAPEHLPFVFDRFYRADQSRGRGTGGVGLGLAIAREFVAAHGGQITACNIECGGSLFAFYLPA